MQAEEDGKGSSLAYAVRLAAWLIGGGALVVGVFVASFYLAMRVEMRSTEVSVPDLTGKTLEIAGQAVAPLELVLQVVDERNDPTTPSGRILQQTPEPGASVRRGRKVKLVMSLGDRVLSVPELVGQAARAVEIGLRRDGFTPGYEVRVRVPGLEPGIVLAQVPPAGTPSVPNARVHRLVSGEPPRPTWVMPDLSSLNRAQAEGWAARSGFRVAVRAVRVGRRPSGAVVGQFPLAGYPIRTGDVIELTVAR